MRMLSIVTLNCHVTKIVINSGSQLSELYAVTQRSQVPRIVFVIVLLKNCQRLWKIVINHFFPKKLCATSMHFSLFPTQDRGGRPKNVCLTSLLVDDGFGWCLRNENLPAVGRGTVATAFYCSHHGWVEAVGHAKLEVFCLRKSIECTFLYL